MPKIVKVPTINDPQERHNSSPKGVSAGLPFQPSQTMAVFNGRRWAVFWCQWPTHEGHHPWRPIGEDLSDRWARWFHGMPWDCPCLIECKGHFWAMAGGVIVCNFGFERLGWGWSNKKKRQGRDGTYSYETAETSMWSIEFRFLWCLNPPSDVLVDPCWSVSLAIAEGLQAPEDTGNRHFYGLETRDFLQIYGDIIPFNQ